MGTKRSGFQSATERESKFFLTPREKVATEISSQSLQNVETSQAFCPLDQVAIDPDIIKLIPADLARQYKVLPLSRSANRLKLAMVDPSDLRVIEDLRLVTDLKIDPVMVNEAELNWALDHYRLADYSSSLDENISLLKQEMELLDPPENYEAPDLTSDPLVRLVDSLLTQAVLTGASDIHIEPQDQKLRIRLRIDGDLSETAFLPLGMAAAIVSRLKILSGLDISEKRLPQDGRLTTTLDNRKIGFRVATIPSIYGEKLVLRVLDQSRSLFSVDNLGLYGPNRESFDKLLECPQGLVLVTGPTGSGKTSTLYAILDHLNSPEKNIITLEDPVEYALPGIVQIQINTRVGLSFATGLRSVLRVDPDIIMVGEIRDAESAHLAVQAALTGHLVLTTLHTTSAAGTVTRLIDMGIEPFLLAAALVGVVSQRLVRMLCSNCREAYILTGMVAQKLGLTGDPSQFFYRNRGCHRCRFTGYDGRMAIQEVLEVDSQIKELISRGVSEQEIEATAHKAGMVKLRDDGLGKARRGFTSIEEVLKTVVPGT